MGLKLKSWLKVDSYHSPDEMKARREVLYGKDSH